MKMNDEQVANTLNTQLVEITGLRKQIEMYRDELSNVRQQLQSTDEDRERWAQSSQNNLNLALEVDEQLRAAEAEHARLTAELETAKLTASINHAACQAEKQLANKLAAELERARDHIERFVSLLKVIHEADPVNGWIPVPPQFAQEAVQAAEYWLQPRQPEADADEAVAGTA